MALSVQGFPTVTARFLREAGIEDPNGPVRPSLSLCSEPKSLEGECLNLSLKVVNFGNQCREL